MNPMNADEFLGLALTVLGMAVALWLVAGTV